MLNVPIGFKLVSEKTLQLMVVSGNSMQILLDNNTNMTATERESVNKAIHAWELVTQKLMGEIR